MARRNREFLRKFPHEFAKPYPRRPESATVSRVGRRPAENVRENDVRRKVAARARLRFDRRVRDTRVVAANRVS